jgi:ABC-2 type transport system permease protein
VSQGDVIEIRERGKPPRRVTVERPIEMGRECDGEQLADLEVSRRHLRIQPGPHGLSVTDLGSRNGTTVNGQPVGEETLLRTGDVVRLGQTEVAIVSTSSGGRETVTARPAGRETVTAAAAGRQTVTAQAEPPAPVQAATAEAQPLSPIKARPIGFLTSLSIIARRALRQIPQDPASVVPAVVMGSFLYVVMVGTLKNNTRGTALQLDYESFMLPTALIFAVTNISRAGTVVADIQGGYFDRLLLSPVRRMALMFGLLAADLAVDILLALPILALGFAYGVSFGTGPAGMVVFVLIAGLWGVLFNCLTYALCFKTGNPQVERAGFLIFFPFLFLTSGFVPRETLAGWIGTVADVNPVTYLFDAMRALEAGSWDGEVLGKAAAALAIVGVITLTLALRALQGRVSKTVGGKGEKAAAKLDPEVRSLREALEEERLARQRLEERLEEMLSRTK